MDVDKVLAKYAEELESIDIDDIIDGLWKEGILKGFERQERKKESFREKLMYLQEILPQRGDKAFPAFLRCLRKWKEDLADRMEAGKFEKEGRNFVWESALCFY